MISAIEFKIITPERIVYEDKVDSVTFPTMEGEITVLPNHIPLVSILSAGELVVRKSGRIDYMAVAGGFVTVEPKSRLVILADSAERAEELSLEAVEAARERAKKVLEEKRTVDEVSFAEAASALERELARVKVARKHRSRGARASLPQGNE